MPHAMVNNLNLYYEIHGGGDPLVVINGLGMDLTESELVTAELAETHKVLVFDNRGAGRTDKPDEPYSIEQMADDTFELMRSVGFQKSNLLGISMGGRIAMELAASHPEMVTKLILTSTSIKAGSSSKLRRFFNFYLMPRLPIFKGKYPQPYYAFARQRKASSSYNGTDRLGRIHVPTLITQGRSDKTTPLELAMQMHNKIKGSKLEIFNGGHMFFLLWDRQNYISAVRKFLSTAALH
jgi:3-oxoadipate enol-lactonase